MIPTNLKYQSKVESAPSRRYRSNIQPQNGSGSVSSGYGTGSTIIINIPTRNNLALIPSESVLKFSTTMTTTATAKIANFDSHGAHGYINRLRVFHGSNLLQDIQDYHVLAKALYDYQVPLDATQGRFSATSGTNNDVVGSLSNMANNTSATSDLTGALVSAKPINRGKSYVNGALLTSASTLAAGAITDNFSINLISLVGALAGGKYLPLFEMTSSPLRVEITLASAVNQVFNFDAGTPTNFTLYNVEYIAEFLELPDSAIQAIKAGSSSPLQMVIPDYRTYAFTTTLQNAVTQVSMPIAAKFSSLKSIVVSQRPSTGATGLYPTASSSFNLQSYTFRIGSEVLPSTAPSTLPDFFNEACKCFGSLADLNYQPSIDVDAFNGLFNQAAMTLYGQGQLLNSGSFLAGIDLESYQNADKSTIFSGLNTNNSDIFYQPIHNAVGGAVACTYTAMACFDSVLVCENGVAYVRF
jgi:hypothetical protein